MAAIEDEARDLAERLATSRSEAARLREALRLMLGRYDFGEYFPADDPIAIARAALAATGAITAAIEARP